MKKVKYLVTTDNWFYAPDGKKYRSAWGNVEIVEDSSLGLKTNRNSTNWYARVGSNDKHIVIAGCQIHYAVKCNNEPNTHEVSERTYGSGESSKHTRDNEIYIAE